jgi:hypothetical protein
MSVRVVPDCVCVCVWVAALCYQTNNLVLLWHGDSLTMSVVAWNLHKDFDMTKCEDCVKK